MTYHIGLAARTYDPEGAMLLPWREGTEAEGIERRVSRTRTLDGGVAVTDRGHVPGDRTVIVSLEGATRARLDQARRLLRLHGNVTVSLPDGCFTAAPQRFDENRQTLTLLIRGTA
ncbi:hypothetical protein [Halomonas koreensis]|uniref:Uncharacterized protein n=1 Tax=Halomonas koreensis TaxID=245385 RepID=A0ABU1G321_9GAMM|nr:hypothetical protein [Halomonas koreensis]MDR5867306.1 hypothetical protein [Halomonas koreensis]